MNQRRIATVQRVRSLREQIARAGVVRRRLELERERERETAAWGAVRNQARSAPSTPSRLALHHASLGAGVSDAEAAGRNVVRAAEASSHALQQWHLAAQRLDGIDRLAERVRLDAETDRQRRELNEIDDLVVMRRHRSEES